MIILGLLFWIFCGLCVASLIEEVNTVYKRIAVVVLLPLIPIGAMLYAIYNLLIKGELS